VNGGRSRQLGPQPAQRGLKPGDGRGAGKRAVEQRRDAFQAYSVINCEAGHALAGWPQGDGLEKVAAGGGD
jgi:hypothetical protein